MPDNQELVTVFRSADPDAEDQASAVRDKLTGAGLGAEVFDDSAPGVPEGAFEVRVPTGQQADAERIVETPDITPPAVPADLSHDLDMVPVFASSAPEAELLATEIRSVLDAQEIPTVLVSGSVFPNLPFEVRVPRVRLEEAQQAIAAAEEAGPAAAEEGEAETEQGG